MLEEFENSCPALKGIASKRRFSEELFRPIKLILLTGFEYVFVAKNKKKEVIKSNKLFFIFLPVVINYLIYKNY